MKARHILHEVISGDSLGHITFPDFRAQYGDAEVVMVVTGSGESERQPDEVRVGDIIEVPDRTGRLVRLRVTAPSISMR